MIRSLFWVLVVGVVLALAGLVSADVFLDGDVFIDADVFYDGLSAGENISIALVSPVDELTQSHNTALFFNASASSSNLFVNSTLFIWDGLGDVYFNVSNLTVGNGSKIFGSFTLPVDSYLWGVYGCDNASCLWSVNQTFTLTNTSPLVSPLYPPNNSFFDSSDILVRVDVNQTADGLGDVNLSVWNLSGSRVYYEKWYMPIPDGGDTNGDGNKSFYLSGVGDSNYTWSVLACDLDGDCSSSVNYSFYVEDVVVDPVSSGGECLSDKGFFVTYTADPSDSYLLLNLSSMGSYLSSPDASNVWVEGASVYKFSDYYLVVNVSDPGDKQLVIWLAGYTINKSHASASPSIDSMINLGVNNFTQSSPAYWIDIMDEASNLFWNYSLSSTHVLDVYCQNVAPDTIDLISFNRTSLFLTMIERPWFHGILDESFNRYYDPSSNAENLTLYFLVNGTPYFNKNYRLEDYTGTFSNGYFRIISKINETLRTLSQKKWYHLMVNNVSIANNSYIQYVVYTDDDVRVITWDNVLDAESQTISIREHQVSNIVDYSGVGLGFTSSYESSMVGVIWNVPGDVESIDFTVYSQNASNQYVAIYDTSVSSPASMGSINYVVPNQNLTYALVGSISTADYGDREITGLEVLNKYQPSTGPFKENFNLPGDFLGLSSDKVFTGASMFAITFTAMMFSSINAASGGILMVVVIVSLMYFNWFEGMTWGIFSFLFAMAVLDKFSEGRKKK